MKTKPISKVDSVLGINGFRSFYDKDTKGMYSGFTGPMRIGGHVPPKEVILSQHPEITKYDFYELSKKME